MSTPAPQQRAPKSGEKTPAKNGATGPETLDPEAAAVAAKKKAALGTLRDFAIALVVLGGIVALYAKHVATQRQVHTLAKQAQTAMGKDNLKTYLAAEALFDQALDLNGSDAYALSAQALNEVILSTEGGLADRAPKAAALLSQIDEKKLPTAERFAASGLNAAATGHAADGEALLVSTLKDSGNVAAVVDALAWDLRAQGKLSEARFQFKKAAEADWRAPRYAADLATAFLEDGDYLNASLFFDKALVANSDHLRSMVGKALASIARNERLAESGKALEDVLSRPLGTELSVPLKARALAARAALDAATGKPGLADADAALAANPKEPLVHQIRGVLLARAHQVAGFDELEQSVKQDPYVPSAYFDGAVALMDGGFPDKAIALLNEAATHLKDSARYHLAFGRLLSRKGDLDAAAKQLDKALELDGASADALYEKGRILVQKNDAKAAAALFEKAVSARDQFPEAYQQLAYLYLGVKDVKGALDMFKESMVRYKRQGATSDQMDAFYADLTTRMTKAGQGKLARQFVDEARKLK